MKFINKYRRYSIYHFRWQVSAFIMMPIMMLLEQHLPLWQNLMVGQFFGAIIFYNIDKFIFKVDDNKEQQVASKDTDMSTGKGHE